MREPKWLTVDLALAIHDEALASFGGASGLRAAGLLESAVARARQRVHYDATSSLLGNKRTSLLATRAFLFLNGWELEPRETDEVQVMVGVATGQIDEPTFARWLESSSTRRRRARRR
jgi:death-on-curing protein